jgi:hypothetical protein
MTDDDRRGEPRPKPPPPPKPPTWPAPGEIREGDYLEGDVKPPPLPDDDD